jgi:hypothetical protein
MLLWLRPMHAHLVAGLVLALATTGCGVTSLAMRASGIEATEHAGTTERPRGLDTAPASIAVVRWSDLSLACGRVTDIRVRKESVAWTPIIKLVMGMFVLGEGLTGGLLVATGSGGERVAGGIVLGDAVLTAALIALMPKRRKAEEWDRFGLAYQCHARDGFGVGDRIAPVASSGQLAADDATTLLAQLADGGPLAFAVDGHLLAMPLREEERCWAMRALGSPAPCSGPRPPDVVIPLTKAAAVVTQPVLPPPSPARQP